jgi:hypothetical protein
MSVEIVDPAWELGGAIRLLAAQPASTDPTWSIIQKTLGAAVSPAEHWELMSALQSRLIAFDLFVRSIVDKELEETQRSRIVQAVNTFSHALRPEQQAQSWQHTTQHFVRSDDALQLMWFSLIAKRYRPLRRVTDDERAAMAVKIDEAIAAIDAGKDIPDWGKPPIAVGLRRLRFILQHLVFFGVESAVDQLLEIYNKTLAIETAATSAGLDVAPGTGGPTFLTILNCLVLVANLFWLPDQTTTAFERYQGWYLKIIVQNPRLPKPEGPLLLAPPQIAVEPKENTEKGESASE